MRCQPVLMCYLLLQHVTDGSALEMAPCELLTDKKKHASDWLAGCHIALLPAKFSSFEYQIALVGLDLEDLYCESKYVRLASDTYICLQETEELLLAALGLCCEADDPPARTIPVDPTFESYWSYWASV